MRGTQFAQLTAFVAAAEHNSFTRAAKHLGISKSFISQTIRSLEEQFGVKRPYISVVSSAATSQSVLRPGFLPSVPGSRQAAGPFSPRTGRAHFAAMCFVNTHESERTLRIFRQYSAKRGKASKADFFYRRRFISADFTRVRSVLP
jgi:hypothetical protein